MRIRRIRNRASGVRPRAAGARGAVRPLRACLLRAQAGDVDGPDRVISRPVTEAAVTMFWPGWISGMNGPEAFSFVWRSAYACLRWRRRRWRPRPSSPAASSSLAAPAFQPARRPTELAGQEGQVVAGVRVVRAPVPQAQLLLAVAVVVERGGDRRGRELHGDADLLEVGLDPLGERLEGQAVDGQLARVLQLDRRVGHAARGQAPPWRPRRRAWSPVRRAARRGACDGITPGACTEPSPASSSSPS